jgi:hypothetical protein
MSFDTEWILYSDLTDPRAVEPPGRLLHMHSVGLINDLLRHYEKREDFLAELLRASLTYRHLLRLALSVSIYIGECFHAWLNEGGQRRSIPFNAGKHSMLESWYVLCVLRGRTTATTHLRRYLSEVHELALKWMPGAPWGPEVIHAALVLWQLEVGWCGRRLSTGPGSAVGLPLANLSVSVRYSVGSRSWTQVKERLLRDAKLQFDSQEDAVRRYETVVGHSARILPPTNRRRQTSGDETTRQRDLRWVFLTMAPDPVLGRAFTSHDVYDREPAQSDLNLTTVTKALSGMREQLDL